MCLARSRPTVLTWFMDASWSGLSHHHFGTLTPSGGVHTIKPSRLTARLFNGTSCLGDSGVGATAQPPTDGTRGRSLLWPCEPPSRGENGVSQTIPPPDQPYPDPSPARPSTPSEAPRPEPVGGPPPLPE